MEQDVSTLIDAVTQADGQLQGPVAATAALARENAKEVSRGERYVLLSIASAYYAVLEAYVTELERIPKITPVPHVPAWVRGVTNLRGDILSVVDMRAFLGLDAAAPHSARMLVVRLLTEEFATGLLVDSVDRIVAVPHEAIRPPESSLEGALAPYLSGVYVMDEQLVAVLDLDRFLRSADIRKFEEFDDESDAKEGAGVISEADKD